MLRQCLWGIMSLVVGIGTAQAQVSSDEAMSSLLGGTAQGWQQSAQGGTSNAPWNSQEDQQSQRFLPHLEEVSEKGLVIEWEILSGNYLYDDKFSVTWEGGGSASWGATEAAPYHDAFFGDVEIHRQQVSMVVPFEGLSERPLSVSLGFQGCSDDGICFPPDEVTLSLDGVPMEEGATTFDALSQQVGWVAPESPEWSERQLWWVMGMFLLLGLGLSLTPCMLPMLPVVSAMVMGSEQRARQGVTLTSMYVLGMVSVYAGMGALVASVGSGSSFQAVMRDPLIVLAFATLIVLAGLVTMGVITLRGSGLSQRIAAWQNRLPQGSPVGAYLLGVLATLIMSPCVTGPLAGLLLYIATTGDLWRGTLSLASLGLGMGLPLIAIGAFGRKIMPKPGAWMDGMKRLMGWVLIGVAVWLVGEILSAPWRLALVSVTSLAALVDGWRWQRQHRVLPIGVQGGLVVIVLALWALVAYRASQAPAFTYPHYETFAQVEAAMADHRGEVLVNFTADWCMICQSVEREIFQNEALMAAYDGEVIFYDITEMTAEQRQAMEAHQVFGPPALVRYQEGEVVDQHFGGIKEEEFREWLKLSLPDAE